MAKISRTYRLPEEVIRLIDERDKLEYPTANDYVEKAILAAAGREKGVYGGSEILLEIKKLREEMQEIRRLAGMGKMKGSAMETGQKAGMNPDDLLPKL